MSQKKLTVGYTSVLRVLFNFEGHLVEQSVQKILRVGHASALRVLLNFEGHSVEGSNRFNL